MATSIVMPQMGYDMKEGTVVRWHKQEGDTVTRGEVIADIETDKATVQFEAYTGGVLRKIVVHEGVTIPVGRLIAVITDPDELLPDDILADEPAPVVADPGNVGDKEASVAVNASTMPSSGEVAAPTGETRASPVARRLARERGIDLALVSGTGPGGRIVEDDVLSYAETSAARASVTHSAMELEVPSTERVELSRMRQAIARVTVDSKREAPHFYVTSDVDMTETMSMRQDFNQAIPAESRVSVNDLVIKACAVALQRHPKFNSTFRGDHLQMNHRINIGIAIALEAGLIVPGISGCESKGLMEIAVDSRDLIARANSGTLRNEEYSGTTFSISNMGMFDVDSFSAIIFPPHAAVLAVGTIKEQAVVREGQLVVGQIMKATLSVDHRVADGAEAAQFLMEVKQQLETPASLIL